jgi:dCMP deaminase
MLKHHKWLEACDQMANIFSTCDKRKYASFILAPNNRVVGFGYNGSPPGYAHCDTGACPRLSLDSPNGSSYDNCIANHAEANALLYSDSFARQGGTLIVNGPPCYGCAKLIAASGVSKLVHYIDAAYEQWSVCVDLLLSSELEIFSYHRNNYKIEEKFNTAMDLPIEWTQI